MRRIKPKWLLGGAVLLVAIAVSTVAALAAAPTAVNIVSPTNLNPFYRAEGSVVRVDFTYTSNPTNLPQETTGTVEIWTAGGGTRVAHAQKDLANGTDKTDYINVTLPSSLSEGYYDVRVYINNSDGGPVTDEESSAVLVDNSDPDPVTDLAVWEDDDSGSNTDSSPDGYLNDTSPTLNWTAPDDNGATPSGIEEYVIKLVGAVAGTVFDWTETNSSATTYTITGPLGQDTYTFYLKARDKAGNESVETTEVFTIDTTPPDAPTMDDEPAYTAGTENTVSWTNPPGVSGVRVVRDNDSNPTNGYSIAETWTYQDPDQPPTTFKFSGLSDGSQYWYAAQAQDLAGNWSGWSNVVSSTQDATAPSIGSLTPGDGSWQTTDTPTISAVFTEDGSGINAATIVMKVDGNTVLHTYDAGTKTVSYTPSTALGQGSHTVTVDVSDNVGNAATQASWTFSVDTVAPVFSDGTPDEWTTTKTPDVTVTLTEETSGLDTFTFVVEDSGSNPVSGSGTWDGNVYTWVPDADLTEDETYTVTVNGDDVAGNSADAYSWSFTVDTIAPVIDNGSPTGWQNMKDLTLSAAFTEAGSGINTATGTMEVDGVPVEAIVTGAGITYDATDLGEGLHTVTVNVSDVAGNPATEYEWTFSVDTVAPVLGSQNPDPWTDELQPDITFTAVEDGSGLDETTFSFSVVDSGGTTVGGSGTWADLTYTWNPDADLTPGETYTVTARISDIAGNTSNLLTWDFTVDTSGPTIDNAKILSDGTDMGGGWETNDPSLTFSVDVEDLGVGLTEPDPKSDITWLITKPDLSTIDEAGGAEGWTWVFQPQSGTSTFDPTDANIDQEGVYSITVSAADALGNTATYPVAPATYRFVYDTSAPTLTDATVTFNAPMLDLYEDADGNIYTNDDTPTVTFTVADELSGFDDDATGTITVTGAGGAVAGISVFAGGAAAATITWDPDAAMDDGEYTATLTVDDDAENGAVFTYTFRVDTTAYEVDPGSIVAGNQHDDGTWYINTRRPTWHWTNPGDDPCGTVAGSGVKEYDVQVLLDKDGAGEHAYDSPFYGVTVVVPTSGTSNEVWQHPDELPLTSGMQVGLSIVTRDNALNDSPAVDPPVIFDPNPPTAPGAPMTTSPTIDQTPEWSWTGSTDDISGVDLYHIQIRRAGSPNWDILDTELDIPDALAPGDETWEQGLQLESGTYEIRVRAMDVAGNYSEWSDVGTVEIDVNPVAAPVIGALEEGYNTSPIAIDWNDVTDGANTISYVLEYADNAGFSGAVSVPLGVSEYSFDAATAGEGEWWFRVKTISTVNVGETKESAWSAVVSTIYDVTPPAMPVLTLETPDPTNETPQRWSWTAPEGAVGYKVSVDGGAWTDIGNACTYETTFATTGTHTFAVKAYDWLGNEGDAATGDVDVDVTPPEVPGAPETVPALTSDNTPTWTWDPVEADDLAGYKVLVDGSCIIDVGNVTEFTNLDVLCDGTHTLQVLAYDAVGNESDWSEAGTVVVDTTAPAAPNAPVVEESPTRDTTPKWTWNPVTDEHGPVTYDVYLDGLFQINTSETEWTAPALDDGEHYLQVTAEDVLGNTSAMSERGYVVVDTEAPAAPQMMALPEYTNEDSVTFIWSAVTDAVKYDFSYSLDGGASWTTVTDLTVQTYTVDISGASDSDVIQGKAIAYDAAGNDSAESNVVSTIVDRTGPVVSAVWPVAPVTTADATPTWEWDGNDGDGCGVAGYWVTLDEDITVWTTDTWFTPASALEDGPHTVVARGVDELGNEGDPLEFAVVTTDTTPPNVPGMPQTTSPTNDTTPTWTWGAVSGAASYKVYLDDVLMTDDADETDTQYTPTVALGEGQHYLQVSALDDLGNESAKSEAGYVVIDTTGPVAPVVTLVTPSPTNETPQIWTWSRPADAVRYDFGESADGTTPPATFTNVGNVDTYETNFTSDGTHYVMVRPYDALGNAGDWSAAASVVIDMTAPGVPTNLAVPSPTNDNTPTWTWTASTGDVATYEVSLDGAAAVDIGDVTSFTSAPLADGVHSLKVRALDALRNASAWAGPAEVLVDTVAPVITLINPENGARLNITTASTILADLVDSGSGIDQTKVRLRIDGGEWVAPTAIVGGTLYYVVNLPFEAFDNKLHSLDIEAEDAAKNKTRVSAWFTVELYREGFGFGRLRFPEESD
ncbi:MAG: Ig-like domain-containing protein [Firmicutes bacterium]|nr:Ig-like domain-containing protein [Bacillota bacterium]